MFGKSLSVWINSLTTFDVYCGGYPLYVSKTGQDVRVISDTIKAKRFIEKNISAAPGINNDKKPLIEAECDSLSHVVSSVVSRYSLTPNTG
jgi:hypothetical protein